MRINPPTLAACKSRGISGPISRGVRPTTFRIAVRSAISRPQLIDRRLDHRPMHIVDVEAFTRRANHRNGQSPPEVLAKLFEPIQHILPAAGSANLPDGRK